MREMHWSYEDLMRTPMPVILETLGVLDAEGLARKHMGEDKH